MKEKIENKFIKSLIVLQFVLLVFIIFHIFGKDKNSVPDKNSDYFSLIELVLDSKNVYGEGLLDSTRLITIQQFPFVDKAAFYDSKNNRYYHNLKLFRSSDMNNMSLSPLDYSANKDSVFAFFAIGHRKSFTVVAYRNSPNDDWVLDW